MSDSLKDITHCMDAVSGGVLGIGAAPVGAPARRYSSSSSSSVALQTALSGVTSALDGLKQNQNNTLNQLLPVALMAKWIRQG